MKRISLFLINCGILLFLMGCCNSENANLSNSEISRWVGENIQVQFRRDMLGASAKLPVGPNTGSINGASVSLNGILKKVEANGIVINSLVIPESKKTVDKWIPREVILLVVLNP
jgi:hypothetical protein